MAKKYGCEKNKFEDKRFECKTPCEYIMSDKKCGRLTEMDDLINQIFISAEMERYTWIFGEINLSTSSGD